MTENTLRPFQPICETFTLHAQCNPKSDWRTSEKSETWKSCKVVRKEQHNN